MKNKLLFLNITFYLILYIFTGLVSFFGYSLLYNSSFELGNLCEINTECFTVTQRIIFYDWMIILIIISLIYFITKKKNINTVIIITVLLYNILKINTNMSIPFLLVLNFVLILSTYFLLQNTTKHLYIFNAIGISLVVLIEFLHIGEIFYYNKKYSSIETFFDIFIILIFIISLLFSILRRRINKNSQDQFNSY